MNDKILGLHHITAIAGSAQKNFDFYTKVLGLRMVKKTVNFDDPGTYHFYYGDENGSPGTILTFFPWEGIGKGRAGKGQVTEIGYAIASESLDFWKKRFTDHNVAFEELPDRFGEKVLRFEDPDGLVITLIVPTTTDTRKGWSTVEVPEAHALKGFHVASLLLDKIDKTARILTDIFGYELIGQEGNRHRFKTTAVEFASIIDLVEDPTAPNGHNAAGTNHHIAFRVKDEATQMAFHDKIAAAGHSITPKIDRDYFYSLYFREPGGVLFEIATDNPGFTVDEPLESLGQALKLPQQYEHAREQIESHLPQLN